MHALRSMRKLLAGLGLAAFLIGSRSGTGFGIAAPWHQAAHSSSLLRRASASSTSTACTMGINTDGEVGVDSGRSWHAGKAASGRAAPPTTTSSTPACRWPASIAGAKSAANPWGGDTAGGWFFDGAGGRQQTEAVTQVYQAFNPADAANWPADAFVPHGRRRRRPSMHRPLQGLVSASQGDVHFIAWEGNPAFNIARAPSARHPGRLPPAGVELSGRRAGYRLPGRHGLQRHLGQRRRLCGAPPGDPADPAGAGAEVPGAEQRQVRHHPAGRRIHHQSDVPRMAAGDNDVGNASRELQRR